MGYKSLEQCLIDLEENGHLVRVKEEVDANLEMAAIQLRVYEANGPALLFENIKGVKHRAVSNIFGSVERSKFIFRDTFEKVQQLIELKMNPLIGLKNPLKYFLTGLTAINAIPKKVSPLFAGFEETSIDALPLIKHWPNDGGAFVTLPQVYSEDIDKPGIMHANLGMYRIQLNGNDYITNKEMGLHYQLHRGIGVHQSKSNAKGKPLKVSVFIGGPPSHTLAAVMPLPEGLSEMTFAGALNNRRFRYFYDENGYCISADADFVITGYVNPMENKPEGPFGDHLGYYSLQHDFPLMHVEKVYQKKNAIWPFTVVGRPPQEDTSFGALIHELSGAAIPHEIPGLHEIHAVDAAGVHPLLFAIGSERYTPYAQNNRPSELLTIASHILGKGQLSLAKWLFISNKADAPNLNIHKADDFLMHILERIDFERDLHFITQTSMDTLDYSGTSLNAGSKLILASCGSVKRKLNKEVIGITWPSFVKKICPIFPGVLAIEINKFIAYKEAASEFEILNEHLRNQDLNGWPLLVVCDDASFTAATINNFLWVTFTRSNPSHDVYGIESFTVFKHWGCKGSMIIDSRIKPHHAPVLEKDPAIEKKIERLGVKGASLHAII